MDTTHTFTKKEEVVNAITHGIGILLSAAALVLLVIIAAINGTAWHVVTFSIFGASAIVLYTSSTLLHSLRPGRVKDVFEILDHSSIYFFIAGTYTPFVLIAVKGGLGWTLFGIVWGLAIAGTVFKIFFVKRFMHVSTLLYILMGWLIVLAWSPLSAYMTTSGMQLLVAGGLLYTVGAIFYMWRGFKYHHALWHLFVLAGSITHFFSVATLI
ncbi:hemolysin III family protein [Allobacillus sp. GCM10007491]|uniref:Hemolysin III family protein n=1 Tax=Allobacillus saliphilus TaxID=2912308 RepID=A0A941CS47_9BACI|nr:hemolysin III family protein [Allobacillus saliphilus]MBR7552868.1 hemolysin III family protein [Allobacillus saliphilus]